MHEVGAHQPVLLDDALELCAVREGMLVVDGTLGRGGHAEAFLRRGARLVGCDRDPEAVEAVAARLRPFGDRVELHHARFSALPGILAGRTAGAIFLDLGVSSPQLDVASRGFSFRADAPLDMRMDPTVGPSVGEILADIDADTLASVLYRYGEERQSRRVARAILQARPLRGTIHLAEVVARALGGRAGRIHPATRTFQALRILVNDELGELDRALGELPSCLAPGGRLAVISFHSLEDRAVKQRFAALSGVDAPRDPFGQPLAPPEFRRVEARARKGDGDDNPRARSARLRVLERLPWT